MNALVLSGGGAYGAYEVGIVKALLEASAQPFNVVTGTSVGAFNASLLAMEGGGRQGSDRLEKVWRTRIVENARGMNGVLRIRGDLFSYLNPAAMAAAPRQMAAQFWNDSLFLARASFTRSAEVLRSRQGIFTRAMEAIDASAFFCCEPLKETIATEVDCARIGTSPVKLNVVATNWESGEPKIFDNKNITPEAIMASTAIPGIFPPVRFDNSTWVDGGVTMNTPLKPAIAAGATEIAVISLDPQLHSVPASELDSTAEALLRTFIVTIATVIREDMATADWVNKGIAVLQKVGNGEEPSNEEVLEFTRVAAQIRQSAEKNKSLRPLTIHHYHPAKPLGGPLGLLDFGRRTIDNLIEIGYRDAKQHNCKDAGCVIP